MGKFLGNGHRLYLTDEDLGVFRHTDSCHGCNLVGALAYDLGVKAAVDQDGLADLLDLVSLEEVAATVCEFLLYLLINRLQHGYRLLGGTDHTVVKGLGMDNGADSHLDVRGLVNDYRRVACAYAQSRLAGRIGSSHHAGTAGGQDSVCVTHNFLGQLQGGYINPSDDAFRCAGLHSSLQYNPGCLNGAVLCPGMGGNDNGVSGLQRDQGFKNSGRSGVGGGDYCRDQADGLCHLLDPVGCILFDDAAGLCVLVSIVNVLGCVVVLDDLVFHYAHTGFRHSHLGQGNPLHIGCFCCLIENLVYLLLGVGGKPLLGLAHCLHLLSQGFYAVNEFWCVVCDILCHTTRFLR